jgi:NHLM bacteriocin system ABC transporter peptidase/ATP-binding protein
MEATECGAASLAMVLAYHGLWIPLEQLRLECGVSRDGSKASNILKAARTHGMIAQGHRMDLEHFRRGPFPNIVFWEFSHFVVAEGVSDNGVWLNDPAYGPRFVTSEEFDTSFTGIVMTFKPGPEFKVGGRKPDTIRSLASRLHGAKAAIGFLILVSFFLVIPGLVIPVFSRVFVDTILISGMSSWIYPLLLGMGATALLRGFLTWLQQYFLARLEFRFVVISTTRFIRHVLQLPMSFFAQRYPGDLAERVAANDRIATLLSGQFTTNAVNLLMIVFYALVMLFYDPTLALAGVVLAAVNGAALRYVSVRRTDTNRRLQQEEGQLAGVTMDGLRSIESLKASGAESDFFAKWAGCQAKAVSSQQELGRSGLVLQVLPAFLSLVSNAVVLTFGGLKVIDGAMTVGMLVAFQSLMSSFLAPVNQVIALGSSVQMATADVARLDDVLRNQAVQQQDAQDQEPALPAKLGGRLELRKVSFGYSRLDPPLVEALDLLLEPGMRMALVGASGSGKSTVARLVAGLYPHWEGELLFDGLPAQRIPVSLLRNSLALVDQDIFLFEGTVRDNLTMWDGSVPEARMIRAAKDAAVHEEIASRPGGYGSKVEEWGGNFSGGQRQRLEIARALVAEPSIIVFDEATSALDPTTEQLINENLRLRGCSCLIIAHRLSTIRDCDEIIVLEHGKVVQRGTHDRLSQVEGPYLSLIRQE